MKKIYFLLLILSIISCTSDKIKDATSVDQLKSIFINDPTIISDPFTKSVFEKKIDELCKSKDCVNEVLTWYPEASQYLNIVIVPDLSNRIITLPNTIEHDRDIINHIYDKFYYYTSYVKGNKAKVQKKKTFDRIMVDVSNKEQANGQFYQLANSLSLDLGNATGLNFDYTRNHTSNLKSKITTLYDLAIEQNKRVDSGADLALYLVQEANNKLKPSSFSKIYKNYLFILTDGYLEAPRENINGNVALCKKLLDSGTSPTEALKQAKLLRTVNDSKLLSDWNIIILEARERNNGEIAVLRALWTQWLQDMGCKNVVFHPYTDQISISKDKIDSFLEF